MTHFLLVYDRDTGRLVRQRSFSDSPAAMRARFAAESEFKGRPGIEVVALSAESEQDLRRTHARYFMDLTELVDRMS